MKQKNKKEDFKYVIRYFRSYLLTGKGILRAGSGNKKGKGILRPRSGRPLPSTSKKEWDF